MDGHPSSHAHHDCHDHHTTAAEELNPEELHRTLNLSLQIAQAFSGPLGNPGANVLFHVDASLAIGEVHVGRRHAAQQRPRVKIFVCHGLVILSVKVFCVHEPDSVGATRGHATTALADDVQNAVRDACELLVLFQNIIAERLRRLNQAHIPIDLIIVAAVRVLHHLGEGLAPEIRKRLKPTLHDTKKHAVGRQVTISCANETVTELQQVNDKIIAATPATHTCRRHKQVFLHDDMWMGVDHATEVVQDLYLTDVVLTDVLNDSSRP
mmetsp:Transcript_107381/g.213179  ORF Transcript_107381/g.213179 Transcript_107381/m.213179 type:complete len:267 (-) Transcript_107381:2338-3138(-)